ncbi:multicopper oxidase family protein [Chelatococcus sp. GCM10030263]|uniref:multicopper oxidase family protein n=1 Tax=Chelatococcus sp. GCM10030263 TaxID=3273387 RepID=UPI00361AD5C3
MRTRSPASHQGSPALDLSPRLGRRAFCTGLAVTILALAQNAAAEARARPDAADDQPGPRPKGGASPVRLRAAPQAWPLKAGAATGLWCFEEMSPGPILRLRRGSELAVHLENGLAQPTSLHWHGLRIANARDGVGGLTQQPVAPGATQEIRFTPRDAGTFWYRPLVPAHAAEQTERGLSGLLIIEEDEPPAVDADLVMVIDDWALDDNNQLRPGFGTREEGGLAGRLGNWLTVNSAAAPEKLTVAPGAQLRLRLLNATNARPVTLRFEGLAVQVVAIDGQPADPFAPAGDRLAMLPGSRCDLMVRCPTTAGASAAVVAALGQGFPLLAVATEGASSPLAGSPVPVLPDNSLPQAIDLAAAVRADLVLTGGLDPAAPGPGGASAADSSRLWQVNGIAWPDAAKPLLTVKQGRPVVLSLTNRTAQLQAMHLHGHSARLLHALDDGWEPYWVDTIAVPIGRTVRVAFVAEAPGKWMIGSSILDRLGAGLAAWFEVT